jgi:hypothetical protein
MPHNSTIPTFYLVFLISKPLDLKKTSSQAEIPAPPGPLFFNLILSCHLKFSAAECNYVPRKLSKKCQKLFCRSLSD